MLFCCDRFHSGCLKRLLDLRNGELEAGPAIDFIVYIAYCLRAAPGTLILSQACMIQFAAKLQYRFIGRTPSAVINHAQKLIIERTL